MPKVREPNEGPILLNSNGGITEHLREADAPERLTVTLESDTGRITETVTEADTGRAREQARAVEMLPSEGFCGHLCADRYCYSDRRQQERV